MKRIVVWLCTIMTFVIEFKSIISKRLILDKVSFVLVNKFSLSKTNVLKLIRTRCSRSSFFIDGYNNKIIIVADELYKCDIKIYGKNNVIKVEAGAKIFNLQCTLRGDNSTITIGENTTIGSGCFVCMGNKNYIRIGKECMIADNVEIWNTDSHPIYSLEDGRLLNHSLPITIDDKVWVGKNCTILKGTHVSSNAIIGMNTVVCNDIPANSVSVGTPNKIIKTDVFWNRDYISF